MSLISLSLPPSLHLSHQGKQHLINQPSNIGTASKGSDVKSQLANAILHGEGSARERLRMRKAAAQPQAAQGTHHMYMVVLQTLS